MDFVFDETFAPRHEIDRGIHFSMVEVGGAKTRGAIEDRRDLF